jgi:hypothetical protein
MYGHLSSACRIHEHILTDSFLMAIWRFICMQGTLSRIQSDRGDQLIAALTPDERKGFQWDTAVGWKKWNRVASSAYSRSALQRTGRKDDRHFKKTAS